MPRPKLANPLRPFHIRLHESVFSKADDLCEFVAKQSAASAGRSDVLREAIMLGLAELDARRRKALSRTRRRRDAVVSEEQTITTSPAPST
jgi:hypothetical protein